MFLSKTYIYIYFKSVVAVQRLQEVVNRCHIRFMFAAWCNFTRDSRRIKEVLKVHISSLGLQKKVKKKRENYINVVCTFVFGRG